MASKWALETIKCLSKLPAETSVTDFVYEAAYERACELEGPNSVNFEQLCSSLEKEVYDTLYESIPTV